MISHAAQCCANRRRSHSNVMAMSRSGHEIFQALHTNPKRQRGHDLTIHTIHFTEFANWFVAELARVQATLDDAPNSGEFSYKSIATEPPWNHPRRPVSSAGANKKSDEKRT